MNVIYENLGNLLTVCETMKKDPKVDKKWLNKVNARMEELQVLSTKLIKPEAIADQVSLNQTAPYANKVAGCICPPGALDATCPVHITLKVN